MTARQKLPPRRLQITEPLECHGKQYLIGIGFDVEGRAKEAFMQALKTPGSDIEALLQDACILFSKALQAGVAAAEVADWLSREGIDGGAAASPIGIIAERTRAIEAECGQALREAYAAVAR